MPAPVTLEVDSDSIAWIVFNDPRGRANVFNKGAFEALEAVLAELDSRRDIRAVVLWSAKERIFIAGADLSLLSGLKNKEEAEALSRMGQAIFQRIADLPVPVLAAIHGAAAGGGFEVALAAHHRLASESPVTVIGLPEVGIGTIPGWGGCARLPRLVGVSAAIEHILAARLLPSHEAKAIGLVDEIAPAENFRETTKKVALRLAAAGLVERELAPGEMGIEAIDSRKAALLARTRGLQPAPLAFLEVIARTFGATLEEALLEEARQFGRVTVTPECRALVRTFFLKESFKRPAVDAWFPGVESTGSAPIAKVGVVGAGLMGSGIAQWVAAHGGSVVLVDVDDAVLAKASETIGGLFDEAVRRGKISADAAADAAGSVTATTSLEALAGCDLVIEAIVEDLGAKQELFKKLEVIVPASTIIASNSSALPINAIGDGIASPGRLIGIHFFNPVSRMPLIEIVLGPRTDRATSERAAAWVRAMGKSVVFCRSSPGFIVTRILFFYLNEAVAIWASHPDTRAIDEAMLDFGMPMGPLRLIDEVGLDVTAFIFGEMKHYFPGRFTDSATIGKLVDAGLKGRKSGSGFYNYSGRRESVNEEISLIAGVKPLVPNIDPEAIRSRLLDVMVAEARGCIDEGVVKSADDIDFAMMLGTGFPTFRGGLTHWARLIGKL